MIQKLSTILFLACTNLMLCHLVHARTILRTASHEDSDRKLADIESEQLPILFDFRWATNTHRYFDVRDLGNEKAMSAALKAWSAIENEVTATDRSDRTQLIKLLQQSEVSDQSVEKLLQQTPLVSWSLLMALEQIDTRRGRPSPQLRTKLEETLIDRCKYVIEGYAENSFSRKVVNTYVCQTAARLSSDVQAVNLIEQAINEIHRHRHEADPQLISLHTERLIRLARRDVSYKRRAIRSCQAFCQLMQDEDGQEYLKAYPLALTKVSYSLARLQDNPQEQFDELAVALRACESASLNKKSIHERWSWEAQRALRQSKELSEDQQVELLFRYRREKLRASILLDGYHLLSSKPATEDLLVSHAEETRFSAKPVATSLRDLDKLHQMFLVSPEEQLITCKSLATVLRALNDPESYAVLDRAMEIAWSLRRKELDQYLERMVLECMVEWSELRVNPIQTMTSLVTSDSRLPDVSNVIELVKTATRLKEYPELDARLKRAEIFYHLSGGNADLTKALLGELEKNSLWVESDLLVPSLKLLLAVQTGDLAVAKENGCKVLQVVKNSTKPEHAFPLYALAEFENALEFSSITCESDQVHPCPPTHQAASTLDLYNLLKENPSFYKIDEPGMGRTLWHGNALQLAAAAAHIKNQNQELNSSIPVVARILGIDSQDADYHQVLKHLAELDPANAELGPYRVRALITLAAEELRNIKAGIALQRQANQEAQKQAYERRKADLRNKEEQFANTIKEADELLNQPKRTRQQYEEIEDKFTASKKDLDYEKVELLNAYDGLFRVAPSQPNTTGVDTKLQKYSEPLKLFLSTSEQPPRLSSFRFNARCVLLESAMLLGPGNVNCPLELLDDCAKNLTCDALQFRTNWSGWQVDPKESKEDARNVLFDKYQLGFELAVRWSVYRQNYHQSVCFAALTTNRSLAELKQSTDQSTDSARERSIADLPTNFIAYFSGNESLHVFWQFGGQGVKHAESFVNRKTLNTAVEALLVSYKNFNSKDFKVKEQLLAGWLLPRELCNDLSADTKKTNDLQCVYVAPHGPLFQIPLEGLPVLGTENQESLGEIRPLIYLPTLIPTDRQLTGNDPDSYSGRYLTIQPGADTGTESKDLVSALGKDRTVQLGPEETNEKTVTERLQEVGGWEIVHFGAHAQMETSKPANGSDARDTKRDGAELQDAYIDLKEDERDKQDRLTTSALRRLTIRVKHVLLGVCEAQAANINHLRTGGDTLKTLGTTFLAIGAEDVIASHWQARDQSTTKLFSQLVNDYADLRRSAPSTEVSTEELAELLFKAREKIRATGSHPCDWNVFTIWTLRR